MVDNSYKMDFSAPKAIILVALLYGITGYLGLFFATPPGYATVIWVPSGIALGAVLVWGLRVLPGIFIGSFITNFLITTRIQMEPSLFLAALIGFVIALGAVLQATAGWWLIRKSVGLNNTLIYPKDIFLFAFISGPVVCLVNAIWSNTALLFINMSPANYLLSFGTWWVGDSIGVLIFTPVFLILFAQPAAIWRQRIIPILFLLTLSFMAVVLIFLMVHGSELKRIQLNFSQKVGNKVLHIVNQLSIPHQESIAQVINDNFMGKKNYYSIQVIDVTTPNNIQPIYTLVNEKFPIATGKYYFVSQENIFIQNKKWLVSVVPTMFYINSAFTWQLWFVLTSGLFFCVLVNIILFVLNGQKILAQIGMIENKMALKKEASKNLLILRAAGEGIFGLDLAGHITFVNPAAAKMLSYSENELIGMSIHQIVHHTHKNDNTECPIFTSFAYNKPYHATDEKFWRQDKAFLWVEYSSSPLIENGETQGAVIIFNDITQRRALDVELQHLAHYDVLTGILNRTSFFDRLSITVARAERGQNNLAVCFIDLDNFKHINDSLGHSAGDEALKKVAQILKAELDSTEFLARLGGDEFAILFENINSQDDITRILDRIITAMNQPIKINDIEIHISMSMGVAVYNIAGKVPEELVKNADIAMYHAKEIGKRTYAFFDEALNKKIKRCQQIDTQIRQAVDRDEFKLFYQFQVDILSNKLFGVEALLRWHNAKLGDVSPSEFIPIVETNGLINRIGEWVIRQACLDFKKILNFYRHDDLLLLLNISVAQLEKNNFLTILKNILHETQVPENKLILEVKETALMKSQGYILKIMTQAREMGIHFSLDDFGVGYSSLQYLKDVPVSLVKIDQSLVQKMMDNPKVYEIVSATIHLAKGIGINAIAEGIETPEQLDMLRKIGCQYAQGYYLYKPVPIEAVLNWSQ